MPRVALAGVAVIMACMALWLAAMDVILLGPEQVLLSQQEKSTNVATRGDVEAGYDALRWLIRYDPLNAHAEALSGEFAEDLAMREAFLSPAYTKWWSRARSHYERATALRPQWAYAWARLARANFMQGSSATVTWQALHQAISLDPLEYTSQIVVIYTGSDLWGSLRCGQKAELGRVAAQFLKTSASRLKRDGRSRIATQAARLVEQAPQACAPGV